MVYNGTEEEGKANFKTFFDIRTRDASVPPVLYELNEHAFLRLTFPVRFPHPANAHMRN